MAERIWARWGVFRSRTPFDPQAIFTFWTEALRGRTTEPFITVTFILHLLKPEEFPIMDQFTFRAMNRLIGQVRPDWKGKNRPSNYDDLLTYTEFFNSLLAAWPPGHAVPRSDLDKALMVYGQRLKSGAGV